MKWDTILNCTVVWKNIFKSLYKSTCDAKLRWFQVRLLYKLLPTNRFLYLRKLKDTELCTFCHCCIENLSHLFWDCTHTQKFWDEWILWIKSAGEHCQNVQLTKQHLLMGVNEESGVGRAFYVLLLLAKFHLYKRKLSGQTPNMVAYVASAKVRYTDEKYLSVICNKTSNDWSLYDALLQS